MQLHDSEAEIAKEIDNPDHLRQREAKPGISTRLLILRSIRDGRTPYYPYLREVLHAVVTLSVTWLGPSKQKRRLSLCHFRY